jgi:hypothetical protein
MFCPKCGQPQVSEAARFCSRCGLPLGVTASLLANDGTLPTHLFAQTTAGDAVSPRRRGARHGGALLLVGVFLVPILAIMHAITGFHTEYILIGVLIALVGLLRLLYALIFESSKPAPQTFAPQAYAQPTPLDQSAQRGALPRGEFHPAQGYFVPRTETAEIAPPPSVTDHTTRLLRDDDATER